MGGEMVEKGASAWRKLAARLDEPRTKFFVDRSSGRAMKSSDAPWVWADVWRQVERQTRGAKS